MRYRLVHDDGRVEVFEYGMPAQNLSKPDGLARVDWLMTEVGELNKEWTMQYTGGVQFWFKRQEDFVKFSLFWT
jgi:hypothetical protein